MAAAAVIALSVGVTMLIYRPPLDHLPRLLAKKLLTPVFNIVYGADLERAQAISRTYYHGAAGRGKPASEWSALARQESGFRLLGGSGLTPLYRGASFVFEKPGAPHLTELAEGRHLKEMVAKAGGDEYLQMLTLFRWLGTRWDHGVDTVPGSQMCCSPLAIVAAGESGAKFWCEVSARVTADAATALGWPTRVVTASRDGYIWEHALAEVWSNRFAKWFVVDTNYNLIYEAGGVPLSAYEICHQGPALQRAGLLTVRRIAPQKPSLRKDVDLVKYYRYVHIDLRNDWCTRPLHPGSPAGGDRASWWTARADLGPVITSKIRVDDQKVFDWPVNVVEIHAASLRKEAGGGYGLDVELAGYSPYFDHFETRMDGGRWVASAGYRRHFTVRAGQHAVEARVVTASGAAGPVSSVRFLLAPPAGQPS